MAYPPRTLAFILAPTDQGALIVNRFDFHMPSPGNIFGVGGTLLRQGTYDQPEAEQGSRILQQPLPGLPVDHNTGRATGLRPGAPSPIATPS